MTTNDVVLLDKVLESRRSLAPDEIKDDEYFELFAADQVLKEDDLSTDEVLDGLSGGGKRRRCGRVVHVSRTASCSRKSPSWQHHGRASSSSCSSSRPSARRDLARSRSS